MSPIPPALLETTSAPGELGDLLKREIACARVRVRLEEGLHLAEHVATTLASGRPWLTYIVGSQARAYAEAKVQAADDLVVLRTGLAKFARVERQLLTCVQRRLEHHLRQNDPDYLIDLAEQRCADDWKRLLEQFDQIAQGIEKKLTGLRSLLPEVLQTEPCGHDPQVRRSLAEAASVMAAAEAEVIFLNALADAQKKLGGMKSTTLRRQSEVALVPKAFALLDLLPNAAAKESAALIEHCAQALQASRSALAAAGQFAAKGGRAPVVGRHEQVWRALREAATQRFAAEGAKPELLVAETEARFDSGRLGEWTFLDQAFQRAVPAVTKPATAAEGSPAPVPSAPPPASLRAGRPPGLRVPVTTTEPAVAPTAAAPVAPAPEREPDAKLSLRSRSRGAPTGKPEGNPAPEPVPTGGPGPLPLRPLTEAETATVARLRAEQERLQRELEEARASLMAREEFISQSEARLMEKSQAQIEREVELEQREEELRELERRIREKGAGDGAAELLPAKDGAGKEFDEFNE